MRSAVRFRKMKKGESPFEIMVVAPDAKRFVDMLRFIASAVADHEEALVKLEQMPASKRREVLRGVAKQMRATTTAVKAVRS